MERELAELVVKDLKKNGGLALTVLEAMSMTKIMSDNKEVYALQKSDTTVLAWVYRKEGPYVKTKTVCL